MEILDFSPLTPFPAPQTSWAESNPGGFLVFGFWFFFISSSGIMHVISYRS